MSVRISFYAFLMFCLSLFTLSAGAEGGVVGADSPHGVLHLEVRLDNDGRPYYRVLRRSRVVIDASRLGLLLTDAPKLERNFQITGTKNRRADTRWQQPWGQWRYIRDQHTELVVHLKEKTPSARRLDVIFRVFDDGIGFRYVFPDQSQLKTVHIADELTEFAVAEPAEAWWIVGGEWNRYEQLYHHTPLNQLSQAHTPLTIRTKSGLYMAFHEAALVDYAGMWLRRVDGQRLKAVLAPSSSGAKVRRTAPFASPWRTVIIADTPAGLYASHIELNLNEPNKLGDVSWFKPYKYIGIWWQMHLGNWSWSAGPHHGATTQHAMEYIDFAAQNGFPEVLIEGWNKGWDGVWFANGSDFSFTEAYPDFDLKKVAAYAKARGVKIIGHHESAGNIANYEKQLDAGLDLLASLGYDSIKTGYVADAGGIQARGADGKIHFEWHDGQVMSRHHLRVVQAAAKRHIAVNAHEPIKDTGLRRTYPNRVSREGARGMEYNAWGNPPNLPDYEPTLVFTRMLAGPFDYTLGALSLTGKGGQRIPSTIARQLALYVVIYSPVQMAMDLPENYRKYPGPFQFIKDVPCDWSDSRVLNAEIGKYVTFARRDRNSDDWYLGAITDEKARTLAVKLDFLDPGRRYRAEIYRDGPHADWKRRPHDIVMEKRTVQKGDTLTLHLAPGGGTAIRFAPG